MCLKQMDIDFDLENATVQLMSPIVLHSLPTVVFNTVVFRVPLETVAHSMVIV